MAKSRDTGVHGLAVIDKPAGWTSHDVVAKCRAVCGQPRAGHSGTLDPDATGVLIVGFGRLTKLLPLFTALPKRYTGEVVLGTATSTLDASGEITATADMSAVTVEAVRAAAAAFVGDIRQIPPMVSAVQIGGKRLHELARRGIEVERPPRTVTVTRLDVTGTAEPGVFRIEVDCSTGTYVRVLAADLGAALGGYAHLRNLVRTAIGPFSVAMALPLERFAALDVTTARSMLLTPTEAVAWMTRVEVPAAMARRVRHGAVFERDELGVGADDHGPWALVGPGEVLLAVYGPHDRGRITPVVVLPD